VKILRMEGKFTNIDLVRFIYNETSQTENSALNQALENNAQLSNEFKLLSEGKEMLPKVLFNPSEKSLQAILNYSQKAAHEPQH
jgi:hypothetical protein